MDTLSLRLFVLASEMLNISAAGRQLGMAPAVASSRLAKLEHGVGADLLHRSTRKVALSTEGEAFLPFAREILAQEDAAFAALGKGEAKVGGTLRFAAPSTFAQMYILPVLPELLQTYPGITLDLRLSDTQFDLIEGSFDLALRNAPLTDSSLKGRKLADDTRILCASPGYLERHGVPQSPDDLSAHKLIAFRDGMRRPLRGPDGETGAFHPSGANTQLMVDDGLSLKLATMAGAGISLNSLWSVHAEIAVGSLVHVLPDYEGAESHVLWLVYPKTNVLSPKVRVFMDFLIERLRKLPRPKLHQRR
ncbi:MAG: LysR substrate-binding domain-containing protein [Pseudomonadota bacterium]